MGGENNREESSRGAAWWAEVSLINRKNSPVTEQSMGIRMSPSVTRESNKPSLSMSENGVSVASRQITRQTMMNSSRVLFFLHMTDLMLEQYSDMKVIDAVIVFLTFAVRQGRFGHANQFCHIGNGMLVKDGN